MKRGNVTTMGPGQFLSLITRCGFELTEVDLAQLARRKILVPWDRGAEESWYTELHLFVVARYFQAVQPTRHPWGTKRPDVNLDEISELGDQVNRILDAAFFGDGQGPSDQEAQFIVAVERFLARIDPFGPLGDVFDLLQARVVAELANSGRLYLEVKAAVEEVSARLHGEEVIGEYDDPKTEQLYGVDDEWEADENVRSTQVIGDEDSETSEAARDAIDEVVTAATDSHAEEEGRDSRSEPEDGGHEFPDTAGPTQVIEVPDDDGGLTEESSEPIVLRAEEDVPDDADGERGADLDDRLEKFSQSDDESAPVDDAGGEDETPGGAPPPSPVERIAELNRRRQVYMKEESWDDLVDLYEDGIGLFTDPEERQQIFLALAMLYEVKLRKKDKAFDTFARAWKERTEQNGSDSRNKALKGLQRLGKKSGLHERYMAWLHEQLSRPLEPEIEGRLQKELALGLFSDQQYEEAFSSYASFLAKAPEQSLSRDRLGQLVRFGEHVDGDRVEAFFEDLRQRELESKTQALVDEFAPAKTP